MPPELKNQIRLASRGDGSKLDQNMSLLNTIKLPIGQLREIQANLPRANYGKNHSRGQSRNKSADGGLATIEQENRIRKKKVKRQRSFDAEEKQDNLGAAVIMSTPTDRSRGLSNIQKQVHSSIDSN